MRTINEDGNYPRKERVSPMKKTGQNYLLAVVFVTSRRLGAFFIVTADYNDDGSLKQLDYSITTNEQAKCTYCLGFRAHPWRVVVNSGWLAASPLRLTPVTHLYCSVGTQLCSLCQIITCLDSQPL